MNVLLDTCAVLWLASEDPLLSPAAREAIDGAWNAYVSPVSAWEIGLKLRKGQLTLAEPFASWWPRVIETHDLAEFPLHGDAAIRSTTLPPIHSDPADRFLAAVALENQLTLLTPDEKIRRYPGLLTIW